MNERKKEELFLTEVRSSLDASVNNLDDEVCSRLVKSRRKALESRGAHQHQGMKWFKLAFAGLALIVLIWLAGVLFFPEKNAIMAGVTIEDLEIATSGENPDFYKDMDFYLWLSTKKDSALHGARRMVFLPGRAPRKSY